MLGFTGFSVFTMTMTAAAVGAADVPGPEAAEPAHPGTTESFAARGNEPGWSLEIREDRILLTLDYGERKIEAERPQPHKSDGVTLYVLDEQGIRIGIRQALCRDDMTGMPHPVSVAVETPERVLRGCGGEPRSLLDGPEWRIEVIEGEPVREDVEVTLGFLEEDRIAGASGCNRYMGGYNLTGEGLSIGKLGSTMMACPEPQMAVERRFLDLLEAVARFDITEEGALVLMTNDGREARARR